MSPEDNIEESIRQLRRTTSAETDERILNDAFRALEESGLVGGRARIWRTIKVAGVAVVIAAVFIGLMMFTWPVEEPGREVVKGPDVPLAESVVETAEEAEGEFEPRVEVEIERIMAMAAAGDVDGLVAALREGELAGKLVATYYLGQIGDLRTVEVLEKLSAELGGDDPNNIFAAAVLRIKGRVEQEEEKRKLAKVGEGTSEAVTEKMRDERKQIHGWLVDANGEPVRGVVQIGGQKSITGEDGAFTLREPTYEEFTSSFGRAFDVERNLGSFFTWDRNRDTNEVEIVVEPMASVSGFVVDRDANAIEEFSLKISVFIRDDIVYSGSIGEVPWEATTGSGGSFELGPIPVGMPLELAVKRPGFKTTIKLEEPAAGENLALGQIVLEPLPGFDEDTQWNCSVAGFVVDESNEPMVGARITAHAGEEIFEITTDANGRYGFKGLPGGAGVEIVPYFDGYGHNPFTYTFFDANNELDIQIFPQAHDWFDKPAPGLFVEKWFNTEPIVLDDLRGEVVLLYIGADSSQTLFIQEIKNVYEKYEEKGLTVIAIHKRFAGVSPGEDRIQEFIRKNEVSFPFGLDEEMDVVEDMMLPEERFREEGRIGAPRRGLRVEGAMYSLYEVKANPAYYVIDREGILRASPGRENLEEWIELLLEE